MPHKNDLVSIYLNLLSDKNMSASGHESQTSNGQGYISSGVLSIKLAAERSIQMMHKTMLHSYNLFYLIGCLPDGIKKEHLAKIWPHEK